MAVDLNKYLESKGTHYISNSGSDENKKYHGGKAGDQTGHEWELRSFYKRPWTHMFRFMGDSRVGATLAELGIKAALNNKVGYDQYQRTTYWAQLKKVGYDPSAITVACEEDCSAGVAANVKACGYLLGLKALQDVSSSMTSRNTVAQLRKAGFTVFTDSKYLTSGAYLLPGDILLCENHHVAMNITRGAKSVPVNGAVLTSPEALQKGASGAEVKQMQKYLLKWNGACLPRYGADGDFGSETLTALKKFQMEKGLTANGICDKLTWEALSKYADKLVLITGGSVNIRSKPNTTGIIKGVVHKGDTYPYVGTAENGWFCINFKGADAFVSNKYSMIQR